MSSRKRNKQASATGTSTSAPVSTPTLTARETAVSPNSVAAGPGAEPGKPAEGKPVESHSTTASTPLQRAVRHAMAGHYDKAFDLLRGLGRDPMVRNTLGVCLLRLNRHEDAVAVFRELVLNPGCVWARPDVPPLYKINFAAALLCAGHPSGALAILDELNRNDDPEVKRLRAAVRQWARSLPWLQRLNWWTGRIEPPNCRVTLDFPPGQFDPDLVPTC